MPELKVFYEVWCKECGTGLCLETELIKRKRECHKFYVSACPGCQKKTDAEITKLKREISKLKEVRFDG